MGDDLVFKRVVRRDHTELFHTDDGCIVYGWKIRIGGLSASVSSSQLCVIRMVTVG